MRAAWGKRAGAAVLTAAMVPALAGMGAGVAGAWGPGSAKNPPKGFKSEKVDGAGMPAVTVRSWASTTTDPAKAPTVVLLDGLRATQDVSGWERDSNVAFLSQKGVNVVMPVGGTASFYTNWANTSKHGNGTYKATWGNFLASSLPNYIKSRGFSSNLSLVGISMGGGAALINAANNPGVYKRAAALSGFLNTSAPGMPVAVGVAMLDAGGYNVLDMWGGPFDANWAKNDPTVQVGRLKGTKLWITASTGEPGKYTPNPSPADIVQGVPLEILAKSQSEAFKAAADKAGVTAHYDFSSVGTHTWGYWSDQVWQMQRTGWFN
ncbi:esterase family protein [Tsukamurella tyrosinosolvens]|uniref:alpha/beta hydrolase n=1 Tax=Tsukamurella tyrosinosolvens TaxID=57704 RepID=UPI00083806A4|nr:alpha/beta hydrolase family protein [Tsukamurella tyrosinosolvens]MCA4996103.1 esterase family protein [Tsukamurella tyrosinosolvens]WEL93528.1 alpha/beta hydrolase family protein [Tsukamurella tyrosinosolvens]